ncbi:hypothetical protein LINPERPRIM_LOCUS41625, partial [Linum perenne]
VPHSCFSTRKSKNSAPVLSSGEYTVGHSGCAVKVSPAIKVSFGEFRRWTSFTCNRNEGTQSLTAYI